MANRSKLDNRANTKRFNLSPDLLLMEILNSQNPSLG